MTNAELAYRFEQVARLVTEQQVNLYRMHASRRGAETLRHLDCPAQEILHQEGEAGLRMLPGIGESLARAAGWATPQEAAPVAELPYVDHEHREKIVREEVPRIALRRFNPIHEAWLLLLHTQRRGRQCCVLLSNPAKKLLINSSEAISTEIHVLRQAQHERILLDVSASPTVHPELVEG